MYKITTTNTGAPTIIEYFDSLSRKVLTQTRSFHDEVVWSNVETRYDALGQVWRASRPYFDNASVFWIEYGYDHLGRATSENSPVTGTTTIQHSKLTTIVTNDKGQITREIKNARGLTIQTIDAATKDTDYTYDPVGNLLTVTDSAQNTTENVYDVRGHKIQTDDPDMGLWKYQYDVLGQLQRQTDAKGQVACFWYDKLGRMTQRSEWAGATTASCDAPPAGHEQATWVYDTAAKGVGQLARESNPGFSRAYGYDQFSRPTSTTTTIDGLGYATSQSYDALGRVSVLTYPTGFAVRQVYKPHGYLQRVQSAADANLVYWQAETVNAAGQVEQELRDVGGSVAGSITVNHGYDARSGRLTTIQTSNGSSTMQNLSYRFDDLGNLEQRSDTHTEAGQTLTVREDYLYDERNRLTDTTTVTGSGSGTSVTQHVDYDDLGNIETKTGMGSYTYDPARPHVVTGTDEHTYTHDANGNMLSGADRSFTWNVANLPTKLTRGGFASYFAYGSDRARYKQSLTGSGATETTHYVGGLYEHITKGSLTTRRHAIYAQGQAVALYITRSSGGNDLRYLLRDHLGSVDVITRQSGEVVERLAYDAWGKRRLSNGAEASGSLTSTVLERGFTGHEHLDDLRLIHMGGRVYYPALGRFISADPFVQFPKSSQSLNRYAYVLNNPLSYTDPSGFGIFGELLQFQHTIDPVSRQFDNILAKSSTLQSIGGVAAGVASVYFGPWVAAAYSAHLTNIQGGSTGDILKNGAIAGAAAQASGSIGASDMSFGAKILAQGVVGGAVSEASGGEFREGFYAGAVTTAFSPAINGIKGDVGPAIAARTIVAATIGGTASELSGGKFANGAQTAAFLQLTAEAAHYYKSKVGHPADIRPGENRPGETTYVVDPLTRQQYPDTWRMNTVGNNNLTSFCRQGSTCSKFLNVAPLVAPTSGLHDYYFNKPSHMEFNLITNVGSMLPAAAISAAAVIGNVTQGWHNNPIVWQYLSRDVVY